MKQKDSQRSTGGAVGRRLLLCFAAAGTLVVAGCGGGSNAPATGSTASLPKQGTSAVKHVQQHPGESIVATAAIDSVPIYRSPSAGKPFRSLANPTSVGAPLVFLVESRAKGWEHVYLPVRPDGAMGWVKDRDVSLAWNPYSLQAQLTSHRLTVRKDGRVVARYPAAVGRSVLPTPTGRYYLVELLKQPDPHGPYGPYAFGTSAFSKVLYHFGGGPGQIGIHGTDESGSIGNSVSHGCIRLRNSDIVRLAHELPLGTPITIVQ